MSTVKGPVIRLILTVAHMGHRVRLSTCRLAAASRHYKNAEGACKH